MTPPPLATVIVPVFNRPDMVLEALDSIRLQEYGNLEIVVVDDGSTDNTCEQVVKWQRDHPETNLRLIRQANAGAAKARNLGLANAAGEYVAFLDSDDLQHPQFLSLLITRLAASPAKQFIVCDYESTDKISTAQRLNDDVSHVREYSLDFLNRYWNTWNVVYRKQPLIDAGGWREQLRLGWQDRELCLRLQILGLEGLHYEQKLVMYRSSAEDRISNLARMNDTRFFQSVSSALFDLALLSMKTKPLNIFRATQLWIRSLWFRYRSLVG